MANIPASPFFPRWAERVAEKNHAFGPKLLTVKKIDASDISAFHNGFLLPRDGVENKLVPYLTAEEKEKASLLTVIENTSNGEASSSGARRNYDGLNVPVFIQGGWRLELLLTHNDESGDTVIRGNELELLRRFGNFREGDFIAIWLFRISDYVNNQNRFCFCLVKIDWSLIIAETSEYNLRLTAL